MNFRDTLTTSSYILMEGSIRERLHREFEVAMDPHIQHSRMIYDSKGREVLEKIYRQYMDIGCRYQTPLLVLTPTRRANREQIKLAGMEQYDVNGDCFRWLNNVRQQYQDYAQNIFIGGLGGCRGDAYKPGESLSREEAYRFHQYQIRALVEAGVDFLIAETLPALEEALGIAGVMSQPGCPYMISFVIRSDGTVLDGTRIGDAIRAIDETVSPAPLCFMVNCVHPSILARAIAVNEDRELICSRVWGIQGNTSRKSPEELDNALELQTEEAIPFAQSMMELYQAYGLKILGGCCGTNERHIEELARRLMVS